MKRITISFIALILVILMAFYGYDTTVEVKKIRKLPDRTSFLHAVNATEPQGIIYRLLLLKSGAYFYDAAILPWLYGEGVQIKDNYWNRFLLERHLLNVPNDLAVDYIARYPLTPGLRLLPLVKDSIHDGNLESLLLFDKFEQSQQYLDEWIENKLIHANDFRLFAKSFPYLLELTDVNLEYLLTHFIGDFETAAIGDDSWRYGILFYRDILSGYLAKSRHLQRINNWVTDAVASGELSFTAAKSFLSALLIIPETSHAIENFVISKNSPVSPLDTIALVLPSECLDYVENSCEIPITVPDGILDVVFKTLETSPEMYLSIFHGLVNSRHPSAEVIAKKIIEGDDSEIRKGIIVLLSRHEYVLPKTSLDKAFQGDSPRTLLFKYSDQYIGSEAFHRYESLSGHAYNSIGKRFPPYLGGQTLSSLDILGWEKFISDYPWFPANDDAYYRLAHLYFVLGDFNKAKTTIKKFNNRNFVDRDVEPYMEIMQQVVEAANVASGAVLAVDITHSMRELPWRSWGSDEILKIEYLNLAVDWLIAKKHIAKSLNIAPNTLETTRLELDLSRKNCTRSWFDDCELPESAKHLKKKINAAVILESSSEVILDLEFLKTLIGVG